MKEEMMGKKKKHIEFEEPHDYSIEDAKVTIDDCRYVLFDAGSLSIVTPKILSETIERLKKSQQ